MREVFLTGLYLDSFKSFSKPTTLALPFATGLIFLGGRNEIDTRLGSNGAGKSSIWDAVCWCLFGTGVHGQKAAELVSWGHTHPQVDLTLIVNDKPHCVRRRGSPNRLTIDGETATQEQVEQLIGLNRERFLQSVLFGQGAPLFLDMPTAARAELLDAVLDLSLWADRSEYAGRVATSHAKEMARLANDISYQEGKLAGVEDEAAIQTAIDAWDRQHAEELEDAIAQCDNTEAALQDAQRREVLFTSAKESLPNLDDMSDDIARLQDVLRTADQHQRTIDFYSQGKCPACMRPFGDEVAAGIMADACEGIRVCRPELTTERLHNLVAARSDAVYQARLADQKLRLVGQEVSKYRGELAVLVRHAEAIGEQTNPHAERLATIREQKTNIEAELARLQGEHTTCKGRYSLADFWKVNFKKVRLFQIKQILLRMGLEVSNVAMALGIGGWTVEFVTETETKTGGTRQGVQVLVKTPNYSGTWTGFSGGEAQRIRLAVTLGLANMIQTMAGVRFNLEVLDEASQYLSIEGVEDLLTCLQARAETTQKTIFITDHTTLAFGGFDQILTCVKTNEGSKLVVSP